jgi:ectoine hydroxylase-related dioxygenase (phytanoyl-CoA dioxygenase family)
LIAHIRGQGHGGLFHGQRAWQEHHFFIFPEGIPMAQAESISPHDYGLVHEPQSRLFPRPHTADEWANYQLTAEQVRHFRDFGYVSGIRLLDDQQIEALRAELTEMTQPAHSGREYFYEYHSDESAAADTLLFHALGAWRVRPAFHDLLWNPAFLVPAYQLLGSAFRLFHDQLFSKPARHGGIVAWHQDYSYWTWTEPMAHLTCWIGLDDVDEANGCLHYIPGSHRWGLVEKTALAGDMEAVRERLSAHQQADFDRKVPIPLGRGEATFHHPLMMHGSYANRSERPRRATVINVFADGVRSNMDGTSMPGADHYPKVAKGALMGGPYYPLLFDPATLAGLAEPLPTIDTV